MTNGVDSPCAGSRLPHTQVLAAGRPHFNLAENRKDDEARSHAWRRTRRGCRRTRTPSTCRAARPCASTRARRTRRGSCRCSCPWLKMMVDAGEITHPLPWTPAEAFQLLTDLPSRCGRRPRRSRSGAWHAHPRVRDGSVVRCANTATIAIEPLREVSQPFLRSRECAVRTC